MANLTKEQRAQKEAEEKAEMEAKIRAEIEAQIRVPMNYFLEILTLWGFRYFGSVCRSHTH